MLAGTDLDGDLFAVPSIVDANGVGSRAYVESGGVAVHELALALAVEKNLDLARLRVSGRIANDSDLRGDGNGMIRRRHVVSDQE